MTERTFANAQVRRIKAPGMHNHTQSNFTRKTQNEYGSFHIKNFVDFGTSPKIQGRRFKNLHED